MSDRPNPILSVVVAASHSPKAVAHTVASIEVGSESLVEIVVADDLGLDVPRLRRLGLDRSLGRIVVFTEDSCVFARGWADAWRLGFSDPRVMAATGPVVPAMGDDPTDWAVFFCEYAPFLPAGNTPPARLAGNNFAIRREIAHTLDPHSIHEGEVHHRLASRPESLAHVNQARAGHVRRYTPVETLRDRLRFGYEYGRRRAASIEGVVRFAAFAVGPAILLSQAGRLVLTVLRGGRHLGPFLEALPITLALLSAWSVGEWLGWMSAVLNPPSRRRRETAARPSGRAVDRDETPRPRCTTARPRASTARNR